MRWWRGWRRSWGKGSNSDVLLRRQERWAATRNAPAFAGAHLWWSEQAEAAPPPGLLLRIRRQVPRFPIMVLDHARADRIAAAVARRLEAEALLDQATGGGVERPIAAAMGDPAFVGTAVRLDRIDDRDGAADAGGADRGRIVAVGDPAADAVRRGEAAA